MFSEVALYSGVAATDWSWSPLWMDFDNDGLKDLFISNGIPQTIERYRLYQLYLQRRTAGKDAIGKPRQDDLDLIEKSPQIKMPSKFYRNNGDLRFYRRRKTGSAVPNGLLFQWRGLRRPGQRRDQDIVVNNIDDQAHFFTEIPLTTAKRQAYVDITLKGLARNINALGAKIILFAGGGIRTYEKYPVRGFLSSSEMPIHIGLEKTRIDSMFLIWPDNSFQRIGCIQASTLPDVRLPQRTGLPRFDYSLITVLLEKFLRGRWKT